MEERMQMEQEVTLEQMLEARERRVQRQRTLLDRYGQSLICLTMNVAGPVKNSLLIRRGFFWAEELLLGQLAGRGISCLHRERYGPATGNEGFYVVSGDAAALKQLGRWRWRSIVRLAGCWTWTSWIPGERRWNDSPWA